jgi:glycerophosphoryl diester phosphodiesterase
MDEMSRPGKLWPVGLFAPAPAICGHRGCGRGVVGGHVENTMESFLAAVEAGLHWVEVDCRLTADGVLVSRHDPRLPDGRHVSDLTAAETDAAGLLRLEEFFAALPPGIGVDLEVKTALEDALRPRSETTAAAAAALASRVRGKERPLLLSSFDAAALVIAAETDPDLATGLLTWTRFPLRKAIPAAVHLGAKVVAAQFLSFPLEGTPAATWERSIEHVIGVAHDAGLEVVAWCPPPAEEELLVAAGVDCVIVDDVLSRAGAAPRSGQPTPR